MKQLFRSVTDAFSLRVLANPGLEQRVVAYLHQHPGERLTHYFCQSLRRAAARTGAAPRLATVEKGCAIWVDITDILWGVYLCGQTYEPETTQVFGAMLAEGDTVIDIGANAGYFTMLAANRVGPRGQVHAFEPNPTLTKRIGESSAKNGFTDRVKVNQLAVSAACMAGQKLYISAAPGNSGLSSLVYREDLAERGDFTNDQAIEVETVTFDAYLEQARIQHVKLVKIDVELAEAEVVKGMERSLAERRVDFIICETGLDSEADRLIRAHGYRAFLPPHYDREETGGTVRIWGNLVYAAPNAVFPEALRGVSLEEVTNPADAQRLTAAR